MIYKVINEDNTFGTNYDEELKDTYKDLGVWPESNYIICSPEQIQLIDADVSKYVYVEGVPGIFDGNPYGVVYREAASEEEFSNAQIAKYAEITSKYDDANKYYVANIQNNIYANVSWIDTWAKVIQLCQTQKAVTIPSSVRYYQKESGSSKFKNISISDVSLIELQRQYQLLTSVQFSILQPKRALMYEALAKATTTEEVQSIDVNFGVTINEQDLSDVMQKVELDLDAILNNKT